MSIGAPFHSLFGPQWPTTFGGGVSFLCFDEHDWSFAWA